MYHRYACGIEDQDENIMILSGGVDDGTRVTKYKDNGDAEDLPNLNNKRRSHGCGMFRNTNNEKVRIIVISDELF